MDYDLYLLAKLMVGGTDAVERWSLTMNLWIPENKKTIESQLLEAFIHLSLNG
jgi:hypothetical protein